MKFLVVVIALVFGFNSFSQETGEAKIQTSAECGSCKTRIENKLNYTKGIKFAELDLTTKVVEVKYSPKRITLAQIKTILSETGYDADEVKAVPAAVEKLPACCKPGGHK